LVVKDNEEDIYLPHPLCPPLPDIIGVSQEREKIFQREAKPLFDFPWGVGRRYLRIRPR
jgi:hypothetical protein